MKNTLKKVLLASLLVIFGAFIYFRGHPEVFSFIQNPKFFGVTSEIKKTKDDEAKKMEPSAKNRLSGDSFAKKPESNQAPASDKNNLAASPSTAQPQATAGILPASKPVPRIKGVSGPSLRAQVEQGRSIAGILKNADLSIPQVRARVVAEMSSLDERQQKAVLDKAAQLNIPVRIEGPGHKVSLLYDFLGDEPVYRTTLNINAAISTGANLLNQAPYGLDGTGVTVGLWDESRARTNHVELAGKVTIMDGVSANSDHSTHCAGTIAGKGVDVKAKGMGIATRINSFDWNSDYAEMTAYAAVTATQTNMLSISSHSYGVGLTNVASVYNPYLGVYEAEAANTDEVAYAAPYHLIFWAAGNEQADYTTRGGYQSITFNALAKNVITIGAADDAVTSGTRNPAVGTLAYFSSEGPCDDGRIKPDVVGNGVSVYSCVATSTNSYDGTYSGTSMATPNASGSAALLVQLYKSNFRGQIPKASTLKALMIHTADDVGRPGPDYQYGWGYLNVKAAADVILAHKGSLAAPKILEGSITSASKVQTNSFVWDGSSPIRATLVWTDPAGTARATDNSHSHVANLVHDLDLKITGPNGFVTNLPYVMPYVGTWTTNSMTNNAVTATNKVDNVERIDIPAPTQPGTYTITVGMYGTNALTQTNQAYSLIVTGGVNVEANPEPVVNLTAPVGGALLLPGATYPITATATDMAVGGASGQVSKVEFFDGVTLLGEDTVEPYELAWMPTTSGAHIITAKATDNQGATAVSPGVNVTVLVGDGKPTISSFSPAAGIAGDSVTINGNNLGVTSSVRFGSLAATFATNSASQITATVPTSAVTAPITISNSYGSVTSPSNFSILPIVFREDFTSITTGNNTSTTGSSSLWAGNTNFPTVFNAWQSGGAVKIGSSLLSGSIVSKAINLAGNGGSFAVSFKVKGWTSVQPGESIKVTAGLQSQTVTYAATMSGDFESKTLNFTGGTSATTIKIETTSKRAFIDDVVVTATVATSPPVITSASSAGGIAGQAFNYQIAASNSPTSFGASGLPAWASINTTSGVISGPNPTAGTNVVSITASNSVGLGSTNLTITILPSGGGGGGSSFSGVLAGWDVSGQSSYGTSPLAASSVAINTTVGSLTKGSGFAAGGTASSRAWGYGTSTTAANTTNSGTAISNSSFFTFTVKANDGYTLSLSSISAFNYRRSNNGAQSGLLQYQINSGSFVDIGTVNFSSTSSAGASIGSTDLSTINRLQGLPASSTVTFRCVLFNTASTGGTWYIYDKDNTTANDFEVVGTVTSINPSPSPSIVISDSLAAVNTVFGTASSNPSRFTVSGANLTEGITVTPPAGFEVSAGNTNGFAGKRSSIIVGSSGTLSNTPIYVRLAADTDVNTYSGDIVCSSAGASDVTVATVASTVSPKTVSVSADFLRKTYGNEDPELTYSASDAAPFSGALERDAGENAGSYRIRQGQLTGGINYNILFTENDLEIVRKNLFITANGITKSFGQTLSLGAGQTGFTASGLQNNETIGSVTLTASGGTGALDRGGPYTLMPTGATGGTFSSQNYDVFYNPGILSVVAPTFDEWMSIAYPQFSYSDRAPGADPDGDGISNLMEYFLGSDPTQPAGSSGSLLKFTNGPSNTFSMTYQRAKGVTNVSSAVQATMDLSSSSSWGTNGVQETVADKDSSYEEVTATITNTPGGTKMFMRLRVTQP
jgi:hypothetical protein